VTSPASDPIVSRGAAVAVSGRERAALDEAHVLSLATVRPDGRPHVVPLWFHWDGETIPVLSKPRAVKVQNLHADQAAMVAVGEPGFGAVLLDVDSEVCGDASAREASAFVRKYHDILGRLGLSVDDFLETYPVLIRLRPTRWLSWGQPGQ